MNVTANALPDHASSIKKIIPKEDFTKSYGEIEVKSNVKKRKVWSDYLLAREIIINENSPIDDLTKSSGMSQAAMLYRENRNKQWAKMQNLLVENNKKFLVIFAIPKKKCCFCSKAGNFEDMVEGSSPLSEKTLHFCNDDHKIQFSQLEEKQQEKQIKKCTKE